MSQQPTDEQQVTQQPPRPFGYRLTVQELQDGDEAARNRLFLPEHVVHGGCRRAIVVLPGTESGLEAGDLVYYRGRGTQIGDYEVIEMSQVVASEG